ncbi:hypothetical protein [Terracidiphilus gabretensis]|uniref:hypothetical protein n=1 Tax=Terracidiphilus gabretensis TaxID=1577687 RepID=UPI0012F996A5|nr:hypothetical protein [Terracidiphilus gabretensis]
MPDRPQPQFDPSEAEARRASHLRAFRRNQILGLVLFAAAILAWWYFHANKSWIWTPGWWRP